MASSFFKQKRLSCKTYTLFCTWLYCLQIVCLVLKCPKIRQDKNFIEFRQFPMPVQQKLEKWRFSVKVEKVVRIVHIVQESQSVSIAI